MLMDEVGFERLGFEDLVAQAVNLPRGLGIDSCRKNVPGINSSIKRPYNHNEMAPTGASRSHPVSLW